MFEEFMRTTGDDEKASQMAVSIIQNYTDDEIRYPNAKRFRENKRDFIREIEVFIEGVVFAIPPVEVLYDTEIRNQIIRCIADDLSNVDLD